MVEGQEFEKRWSNLWTKAPTISAPPRLSPQWLKFDSPHFGINVWISDNYLTYYGAHGCASPRILGSSGTK